MMKKKTAKTPDKRFERLLSHGYFAPELPPCFVSDRFAKKRKAIWRRIVDVKAASKDGNSITTKAAYKTYISKTSWFNFPRFGRTDRRHGVLNPISYMAIAKVLADHFVKLRSRTHKLSHISTSPLVFDWTGTRAILRPNIDLLEDFRLDLASRHEVYVSADVRGFYHSIYTHSIPWAIRGKAEAKTKRHDNHYSNLIDQLSRNAQDGQTIGLPVGPDTSRILGEVIAAGIDSELVSNAALSPRDASRYVDDYTMVSLDGRSGSSLIAALRRAAGAFELELNQDKTAIISTAAAPVSGWKQIALAHRPPRPKYDPDSFKRFFYELDRLRKERPEINVERWALMNCRSAFLGCDQKTWRYLTLQLIAAYRRNSTLVSLLVELIVARHEADPSDIDRAVIKDFLNHRIPVVALEDRTGELIWLLFLMIVLRIQLDAELFAPLASLEEPMCALLIRYAFAEDLITGNLNTKAWDASINIGGLDGPMWLYAYEAARLDLVPSDRRHIENHSFFSILLDFNVPFLSIEDGVAAIKNAGTGRRIDNLHQARVRAAFDSLGLENWEFEEDLDFLDEDDVDWDIDY